MMRTIWIRINLIKLTRGKRAQGTQSINLTVSHSYYYKFLHREPNISVWVTMLEFFHRKRASGRKTVALANRHCWEFHGNRTVPQESRIATSHMIITRLNCIFVNSNFNCMDSLNLTKARNKNNEVLNLPSLVSFSIHLNQHDSSFLVVPKCSSRRQHACKHVHRSCFLGVTALCFLALVNITSSVS